MRDFLELLHVKMIRWRFVVIAEICTLVYLVKHYFQMRRLLADCPDSVSRDLLRQEIRQREQEMAIHQERKMLYLNNIIAGVIDLDMAILLYCYRLEEESDEDYTEEDLIKLFDESKSRILMYIRWLCRIEPDTAMKGWLPYLEPLSIDSFENIDEWIKFFDKLPRIEQL